MIKRIILTLIIVFNIQSLTKADDIKDFQIEGLSVGDSLLIHMSKKKIEQLKKYQVYPNKKFYTLYLEKEFFNLNTYDFIQIDLKRGDKNYILPVVGGVIDFPNNINKCKIKKKKIIDDIINTFPNLIREDRNSAHPQDKTNKSLVYQTYFRLKNGAIVIDCEDWSDAMEKNYNFVDQLKIYVLTNDYNNWLNKEAYN
ncbi:hypothetical protein N9U23_03155 [Candidatus Pelagibacter sp.]|nr:hypothetical protein [Candidatus Pelagibacter sp.]